MTFGVTAARAVRPEDGPEGDWPDTRGMLLDPEGSGRRAAVLGGDYGVWLPHSCDEWMLGSGTKDEVLADLAALRADLDEAERVIRES